MDFDYTEDQRHLRDEARRFLTAAAPLSSARAVLDNPTGDLDRPLWGRIADQGWLGTAIPDEYGGLGLSHVELAAIAEEIGASLAAIPFGPTLYLFAETVLRAGDEAQKHALLPPVVAGSIIGCAALFEGGGDLVPDRIVAQVTHGRLTGTKTAVVDGMAASHAIVLARESGALGLYVAELDQPGVTRKRLPAIDGSGGLAELSFADVPVVHLPNGGGGMLERCMARAAVLFAFEQIGGADRCLATATEFVKDRRAFGGPIGRFQAVKHKLADIYVANQLARSHAYRGVWALEEDNDKLVEAAAAARVAASDAYWLAARETLHLHGAIGFTWEHDAHLFYRRAHRLSLNLGSPQYWKDRLFAELAAAA